MARGMINLTYTEMVKRINKEEVGIIKFTFWKHFSFRDILGYTGAYFMDENSYVIDRVFISGEFITENGEKFSSTFALGIDEIIVIMEETTELRWKSIEPITH